MVTFLLGLNFGGHMLAGHMIAWSSPLVVCLLVAGGVMAVVFILCERKARLRLLPLEASKSVSNAGILVIGFAHDWVSASFIDLLVRGPGTSADDSFRPFSPSNSTYRCTSKPPKTLHL
jgi:hypothetical protein